MALRLKGGTGSREEKRFDISQKGKKDEREDRKCDSKFTYDFENNIEKGNHIHNDFIRLCILDTRRA